MMSFYDRKGPQSWSEGIVPHFITCNSFIGKSYAKVFHAFLKDCMSPGAKMVVDKDDTIYIIELGAGSGKFTYFMLKALEEMRENPICVVANYLFDTLYHDIFQVYQGQLTEGLISVGSTAAEEPDPLEPAIIQRLDNHYKYNPISPKYYNDEDGDEFILRRVLNWYKDYFSGPNFDKGNNNPEQFSGRINPHIAVHGSFSLMVNYHAIGAWFTMKGGFALHNPQQEASLKCKCDEARAKRFPHLKQTFHDYIEQFGPNDFFVLQKSLKEDTNNPPLRTVVALLKLSDWDPDVFFKFRDVILNHAPSCGQLLRNDLTRGIPRVWENYYLMDLEKDIAFEIGRFYYGIRDYTNALWYYMESTRTIGEHHVTFHNQGLCHYSKGNLDIALENFRKALGMNKDYEKARSWVEKVEKEVEENAKKAAAAGEAPAEDILQPEVAIPAPP
eukprot:GSChrysophyteH1.ASY1.ANO1.2484.1 assembled CDS